LPVDFAIFFVLVFVGHWLLGPGSRGWTWFMILASYVFYAWWDWRFLPLLAGIRHSVLYAAAHATVLRGGEGMRP